MERDRNEICIAYGFTYTQKVSSLNDQMDTNTKAKMERRRLQVQKQSAMGYELLGKALLACEKIDITKETTPIARTEKGKPYLTHHPELHFSISHSGDLVVCALGAVPMGIDVQIVEHRDYRKLARRVLDEKEWRAYEASACSPEVFVEYWTRKESYLKYLGCGISRDLRTLDYSQVQQIRIPISDEYCCTLCLPSDWQGSWRFL